jgi:hypothetical protein
VQDLLDPLPFSLTAGDPGEFPWIPDEPVCDAWCLCEQQLRARLPMRLSSGRRRG